MPAKRETRSTESREAASRLSKIRLRTTDAKERNALDLAISLLEARAFDAEDDE